MAPRIKSIEDLRRELSAKEKQLGKLELRRKKALVRLSRIDKKIAALGGKPSEAGRLDGRRRRGGRPRGRRRSGESLAACVAQVLAKAGKAMRAKDVVDAVKASGYKSASKDFYGIVAAALRETPGIKRVSRGVYKVTK